MSKRKPLPFFEKVEIASAGAEGKAVARVDNMVVFVPFVVPGDVVDIQVLKKKKRFYEGKAVKFHKYSEERIEARCEHFGLCGGCKWQNMSYERQLYYKQKQVVDNLERLGGLELPEISPIIGSSSEYYYRNKLEYTFSNRRWFTEKPDPDKPEKRTPTGLAFTYRACLTASSTSITATCRPTLRMPSASRQGILPWKMIMTSMM